MKKIVLVDDYLFLVEAQKYVIEKRSNAKCEIFSNPLDALKYIQEEKDVDVLVTDYEMPQMNGFELAQKVLQLYPKMRIIVSSGHDEISLLKLSKDYGLTGKIGVITKGCDIDLLIQMINRC